MLAMALALPPVTHRRPSCYDDLCADRDYEPEDYVHANRLAVHSIWILGADCFLASRSNTESSQTGLGVSESDLCSPLVSRLYRNPRVQVAVLAAHLSLDPTTTTTRTT